MSAAPAADNALGGPCRLLADGGLALAGIVLLATVVRLVAIGSRLNVDDAYSWLVASAPSAHAFLHQLAASENTPPLFYLLLSPLPLGHEAWLHFPTTLAGIGTCLLAFGLTRGPFGRRAALLAALAVAVAPLLVSYSNYARGFMVEDLFLLLCTWAVLELARDVSRQRWWAVYLVSAVAALYTEYDAAVYLVALTAAAVVANEVWRRRTWVLALGVAPLAALALWIPQIVDGQHQINRTKLSPHFASPSARIMRDMADALAFGSYGGVRSTAGRWLEFVVLIGAGVLVAMLLRRLPPGRGRQAAVLLGTLAGLTLVGHALAAWLGIQIFDQRYLTILVALAAVLGAAGAVALERRCWLVAVVGALTVLGAVNIARRLGTDYGPDLAPVRAAALALHPRSVLTNNPEVLYYLPSLHPVLDRPFGLGPGLSASCPRPCLIIDDRSVYTGTSRHLATGPLREIGPFELTLER